MLSHIIPDEWRFAKLGDLGEVNRGRSRLRPRYASHLYGGPYPFIQTGDIKAAGSRISIYEQTYSEAGLAQSRLWPAGTMCITIAANIAETGILMFPACFPDSVVGFIPDEAKCNVYFIEYMFSHMRSQIQHEATGSVQDNINLATLDRLRFPLPPLDEQHAIAAVLGALDDKIELNRRMNATLEAMARALFTSWFVDFDPVRAKMEGRTPYGMDAATAALFPAVTDSPLSPIPVGWHTGSLSDGIAIERSGINPGDYADEIFDHYSIPAYDDGMMPKPEFGAQIMSNKFVVTQDVVLLSKLNPRIPRVWMPDIETAHRAVCSTEFLVARARDRFSREFVYALFTSRPFLDMFASLVTGTSSSHQRVKPEYLIAMETLLPSAQAILAFSGATRPLFQRITHNRQESQTLASIRDALLPKLLSGAVRIRDAMRAAEMTSLVRRDMVTHE